MHDWQSLPHVRWECTYGVPAKANRRRKVFNGSFRWRTGQSLERSPPDVAAANGGYLTYTARIGEAFLMRRPMAEVGYWELAPVYHVVGHSASFAAHGYDLFVFG
jgi:hypothetical protein